MTQITYLIAYTAIYLFNVMIVNRFMHVFFGRRRTPLWFSLLSYTGFFVLADVMSLLVSVPLITLIFNLAGLYLVALNYESTVRKRIFSVLYIYLFLFVSECLVVITMNYFNFNFDVTAQGDTVDLSLHVLVQLTSFLAVVIAGSFKNIRRQKPLSTQFCLSGILIFIISIYLVTTVFQSDASQTASMLTVLAVFAMNVIMFYLYDELSAAYAERIDAAIAKQERAYYYNQCEIMKTGTRDLAEFRHDMQNHLSVMDNLLQKQDYPEVNRYLAELTRHMTQSAALCDTGNTVVDSVVNYAFRNAGTQEISVEITAKIPECMPLQVEDTVTILSNLLDNAVTAVRRLPENRRIALKLSYRRGCLYILVENTFDGIVKYQDGRLMTTKEDTQTHGLGLASVCSAVEKYNGCLQLEHDNGLFTASIVLYLPPED
jgi:signal transduction histidine kinase